MTLLFEWDSRKAEANREKHGITFEEATTVFADTRSITIDDVVHSMEERRYVTLGLSLKKRILVVIHTDRGDRIRMISARRASRAERKEYEKEKSR